jgi:transportin-1
MVAMLAPTLGDARPMVRCISCWVLGRYSKWLLERADGGQRAELDAVVAGVCERVLDHNRRVQVGGWGHG